MDLVDEQPDYDPMQEYAFKIADLVLGLRVSEEDERQGLDIGADDYIVKRYTSRKALETFLRKPGDWHALVKNEVDPRMVANPAFEKAKPAEAPKPAVPPKAAEPAPKKAPKIRRGVSAVARVNRETEMYGEYLVNAQGEDVVAGIRTPKPVAEMAHEMPEMAGEGRGGSITPRAGTTASSASPRTGNRDPCTATWRN